MSLCVRAIAGAATIQDGGRPGHMHEGIPHGGAMVPERLARANRAAGNVWDAPAIEWFGKISVVATDDDIVMATHDGIAHRLARGERWDASGRASAQYMALRGGIDAPSILGGRGSLVAAGIGRGLRVGDTLSAADFVAPSGERSARARDANADANALFVERELDVAGPIRVVSGPDLEHFDDDPRIGALATLFAAEFTVSAETSRIGTRLTGARLLRSSADSGRSMPMVRGAIQVPAAGEPIVLGPDHPTTGGYPVIGVVIRADVGRLAAMPIFAKVRFMPVSLADAREAFFAFKLRSTDRRSA